MSDLRIFGPRISGTRGANGVLPEETQAVQGGPESNGLALMAKAGLSPVKKEGPQPETLSVRLRARPLRSDDQTMHRTERNGVGLNHRMVMRRSKDV